MRVLKATLMIGLIQNVISSLLKKKRKTDISIVEYSLNKELDLLCDLAREKEKGVITEEYLIDNIEKSIIKLTDNHSKEKLDSLYTWSKYVKLAVRNVNRPVVQLIKYVDSDNYIYLTKSLSDLWHSMIREEDNEITKNITNFTEAVYLHIIENIKRDDIPSCLALGRLCQKRGDYRKAEEWYGKVIESSDPINGITALMACYEEEVKLLLCKFKKSKKFNYNASNRIRELNEKQYTIYDNWCGKLEERLISGDEVSEQSKKDYVVLMTGYARFERNRDNYNKALDLLNKIPKSFPEIHRVYTEEAMVYQFKPDINEFYNLEKAIELFKKAEIELVDNKAFEVTSERKIKNLKCILMPRANAHFKLGQYDEAIRICDYILSIDKKEYRAIEMKNKIIKLAS